MSKNLTKAELISQIAKDSDQPKTVAAKVLEATLSSISKALIAKKSITLIGFGTFSTSNRAARNGRNPKTGDTIKIPKSTVAKFKPGLKLKEAVNKR